MEAYISFRNIKLKNLVSSINSGKICKVIHRIDGSWE